jgi:tetratricopeptide (TPR) repeat protein
MKLLINVFISYLCLISFSAFSFQDTYNINKIPIIWNLPLPNNHFTGREEILDNIRLRFSSNYVTLALTGIGGIGKTQIAKRYADNNKFKYDLIWWFNADHNLNDQYIDLAKQLNMHPRLIDDQLININASNDYIITQVKDIFRTKDFNWLLIFDNSAHQDLIKDFLPQKHHNKSFGHILITSRDSVSWQNELEIHEFKKSESIKLLKKLSENKNIDYSFTAEQLENYPLAISLAASYINNNPDINKKSLINFNNKNYNIDDYKYNINETLLLSIKKLQKNYPKAFNILVFCSFINNKNISLDLIEKALNIDQNSSIMKDDIITDLMKYSLISKVEITNNNTPLFNIHEVVQQTVINSLTANQKKYYINLAIKTLNNNTPEFLDEVCVSNFQILEHIKTVTSNSIKYNIINNDLFELVLKLFIYFFDAEIDYQHSLEIIDNIDKLIIPNIRKINNKLLIEYYYYKSRYLIWKTVDYVSAIKILKNAEDILNKDPQFFKSEYFYIYLQLAQSYIEAGDLEKALTFANLAKDHFNHKKHNILYEVGLNNTYSVIKLYSGFYKDALIFSKQALKIFNENNKSNNINQSEFFLYLYNVEILLKNGYLKNAFEEANNLFLKAKNYYGNQPHDLLAKSLLIIADAAHQLGNLTLAKRKITESLDIYKAFYNDLYLIKDSDVARAYVVLGDIYFSSNDLFKARKQYEIALHIFNNIYSFKKVYDYSLLYTKLIITNSKLNNQLAVDKYLNLHQKYFDFNHPWHIKLIETLFRNNINISN